MKSTVVLVVFFLLAMSVSEAQLLQTPGSLAVGPAFEVSFPIKTLAEKVNTGIGGSARIEYVAMKDLALVGTVGYLSWGSNKVPNVTSKAHAFELLAGPKFGFGSGVYAGIDLGIYMASTEFSVSGVNPLKKDETKAMAGVFLGYESSGFDVGVRYYPFDSDYTNVTLGIGYWFEL